MDLDYFLDQYYQATHIPVSFFQDRALVSKSSLSLQDFNLPLILLNGLSDPLPELWYSYTSEYLYFGGFTIEEEMVFFLSVLYCLPSAFPVRRKPYSEGSDALRRTRLPCGPILPGIYPVIFPPYWLICVFFNMPSTEKKKPILPGFLLHGIFLILFWRIYPLN